MPQRAFRAVLLLLLAWAGVAGAGDLETAASLLRQGQPAEAEALWRKAASAGDAVATVELFLMPGRGADRTDIQKSLEPLLVAAASRGNGPAATLLAFVQTKPAQLLADGSELRRQAERGEATALAALASEYVRREATVAQAPQLLRKSMAAARFSPNGPNYEATMKGLWAEVAAGLGLAALEGKGLPQSVDVAVAWFRQAESIDPSVRELAYLARQLLADKELPGTAREAILAAAERHAEGGIQGMQILLGDHFLESDPSDPVRAAKWYQRAGDDAKALSQLGRMHLQGLGVPRDLAQALELTRRAAAKGDDDAKARLGDFHFFGWQMPQDRQEALRIYREHRYSLTQAQKSRLGTSIAQAADAEADAARATQMREEAVGYMQKALAAGVVENAETLLDTAAKLPRTGLRPSGELYKPQQQLLRDAFDRYLRSKPPKAQVRAACESFEAGLGGAKPEAAALLLDRCIFGTDYTLSEPSRAKLSELRRTVIWQ